MIQQPRSDFPSPSLRGGVRGGALAASATSEAAMCDHKEPQPHPVKNGEGRP